MRGRGRGQGGGEGVHLFPYKKNALILGFPILIRKKAPAAMVEWIIMYASESVHVAGRGSVRPWRSGGYP